MAIQVTATTTTTEQGTESSIIARVLTLAYGLSVYAFFFGTFVYLIGFVGNWVVPKTIDSGPAAASTGGAIAVNVLLLGLFAIQHTIMARPAFKQWWTRYVNGAIERTT
jgi:protein-S-isoprenylcysteine O-methyltransferase Ste14